jgi:hypothetical protein
VRIGGRYVDVYIGKQVRRGVQFLRSSFCTLSVVIKARIAPEEDDIRIVAYRKVRDTL